MRQIDPEQDMISDEKNPWSDPKQFKVDDRVTFTMPWMGGRSVLVTAKIKEISEYGYAELELLGFWGGSDQTAIEPLKNLSPYTKEDQEYEDTFKAEPEVQPFPPKESLEARKEQDDAAHKKYLKERYNIVDTGEPQPHGYVDQDPPGSN